MSKIDVDNTFFFFDNDIPDVIANKFKFFKKYRNPQGIINKILFVLRIRYIDRRKYKFLKTARIYGQDNLRITAPLVVSRTMTVLEDGLANYTLSLPNYFFRKIFLRLLIGPMAGTSCLGYSKYVNKLILTGLAPIPDVLRNKVFLIDINKLWKKKNISSQQFILDIFDIDDKILDSFSKIKTILFTQPLSEDKIMSEEEKIKLYKDIIPDTHIAIKPHPREKTDYKNIFPESEILESKIPIELLTLNGIVFEKVYTIFSTSVLGFPYKCEIHFTGTTIHPALKNKFGIIEYKNGKILKK